MVLDIDSSLHQIHSENKADTAPNYKGGFGFHPIYCFADATGETLAVRLRPGNAGANNIADHVAVLDPAIAQLPAEIAVGHRAGDDPTPGAPRRCRCASTRRAAPTSCGGARARNVGFAVVARSNASIHAAISRGRLRRRRLAAGASAKTATNVPAPRWPSSPTSSTCPTGPTGPG